MATLPRVHSSKHGINDSKISSPFSTSPRKLQEIPVPEGGHDTTSVSGISMKQYEEQLNGLRKENFHMKLRIYFLEEKLGTGNPPAVQGLLEHNVRLQVEVEELRRQLSDKHELLAAAAEAIDVLEQKGSMTTDSLETSMQNASISIKPEQNGDIKNDIMSDTVGESDTVTHGDSVDIVKLRRENEKALQLIKGLIKKIQQQDKEMRKLKLSKELSCANNVSDSQLEKYEEIVKCKDEHIKDLESKIKELQTNTNNFQIDDTSGNLQQLLSRRLQGLAFFLDKLLAHKCVLGDDKKKLAESILEQSLALPVGLQLDESIAPAEFTMDESGLDVSQALRIEDLTLMFGHHGGAGRRACDLPSESDCWSEPDRRVSQARVGLADAGAGAGARVRPRRDRASHGSRSDDAPDAALLDELARLALRVDALQADNDKQRAEHARAVARCDDLAAEQRRVADALCAERASLCEAHANMEAMRGALLAAEARVRALEGEASAAAACAERLHAERLQLEEAHAGSQRALQAAADEAALSASQAALERARAQHERLAAERELDAARDELSALRDQVAALRDQLLPLAAPAPPSDDDRPTSPDQGIDSDRLSSLEHSDGVRMSPRSLYEENVTLKQKLARTKTTLAETLAQMNAANLRKRGVQRAICREIHKTQEVLRKARDQFENKAVGSEN